MTMRDNAGAQVDANRGSEDEIVSALTLLAAELACGTEERWPTAMRGAAAVASEAEVEEVLLQSHLFVGFPVVLNAFIAWRELSPSQERSSVEIEGGLKGRRAAGERLCARVYGTAYDRLRANVRELSVDLDRWMIEDGYGKTLSRPQLGPVARELCIVALLAAAGHMRQLRSHLHGALNVGATAEAVERAVKTGSDVALATVGDQRRDPGEAFDVWRGLRKRAGV